VVLATQSGLLAETSYRLGVPLRRMRTSALHGSKSAMDTYVKSSKQHDFWIFAQTLICRAWPISHRETPARRAVVRQSVICLLRQAAWPCNPVLGGGEWDIKVADRRDAHMVNAGLRRDIR